MSQSFIDALMHFFALLFLPLPGQKVKNLRQRLYDYFEKAAIIFPAENCLKIYNSYSSRYFFELSNQTYNREDDPSNIRKHLLHEAAIKTQGNLYLQERLLLVLALLEFSETYFSDDHLLKLAIHDLCRSLNLSEEDYHEAYAFITAANKETRNNELFVEEASGMNEELEGVWIDTHKKSSRQITDSFSGRIRGKILFHFFEKFNYLVFRFNDTDKVFLNERKIYQGYFYTFYRNDILVFEGKEAIQYREIEEAFHIDRPPVITLSGKDLSFRYSGSNYSIKPFSFSEKSGQLIGILGNNGVGKSTILKIISNQTDPVSGKIFINGNDLRENRYKLSPALAFIPQEDLIIPELTVYENLLYQAHLSIGNLGLKETKKRVTDLLERLDLEEIAHVRAGRDQLHKINDFKRICIRLAIELIRNPYLIFLDEPLCSLSYSDSRRIISVLKDEAYNGKLIFLTSQIPTAEIFNMFDRVWLIDQDGYLIYSGEPGRSLNYFRSTGLLPYYYIQSDSTQLSAEDVIKVVETKKIHTDGSVSDERQVAPGTWYDAWREKTRTLPTKPDEDEKPVPILPSSLPGIEKQFFVYLFRNLKLKFRNMSYLLLNFVGIPAVAVLLAWSIRAIYGKNYVFAQNEYLPLYLFLSVNFIIFGGLLTGAEEVYRERTLIKRDMYLNLSMFSYKNSKLVYLILVSFIQTFIYTLAGNYVLGIQGMMPVYLFVFFSLAVFANLLALSLSSAIRKLNNIYIVIPFLLIPNLLFSGFLIRFDKYPEMAGQENTVPLAAEFIPTRWAFEALMFEQFADNPFSRHYFRFQRKLYENQYILERLLPALEHYLAECEGFSAVNQPDSIPRCLEILKNEISRLGEHEEIAPFEKIATLQKAQRMDEQLFKDIYGYLTYVKFLMENNISEAKKNIEETRDKISQTLNNESYEQFRDRNRNIYVESWLKDDDSMSLYEGKNKLFKRGVAAYLRPESPVGRAQFFSPEKRVKDQYMSTLRFNLTVLWFINLIMYLVFLTDALKYLLKSFSTHKDLFE